jgi:hypothetical protein
VLKNFVMRLRRAEIEKLVRTLRWFAMSWAKAVRVDQPNWWRAPPTRTNRFKNQTMKTLTKLALTAVILATAAVSAQAQWVNGHFRSNGTYVLPYYRTPANGIAYDNLSYRGYPSQQPGYVAPRNYSAGPWYATPSSGFGTSTSYGNTTYHSYQSAFGGSVVGMTTRYGNTSYTTLRRR